MSQILEFSSIICRFVGQVLQVTFQDALCDNSFHCEISNWKDVEMAKSEELENFKKDMEEACSKVVFFHIFKVNK